MGAYRVILSAPIVFVRTMRHPAVEDLTAEGVKFESLDYIYESADTFENVYAQIACRILDEAKKGDVVYAVPGHPLVGESAVRTLIRDAKDAGQEVEIIGSESFIDSSLTELRIGMDEGMKILDALSMDRVSTATDVGNLIYQVYDRGIASEVKLKLMDQYPDEFEITVIFGGAELGERIKTIPLYMLDRCDVDHLTSVWVPAYQSDEENNG